MIRRAAAIVGASLCALAPMASEIRVTRAAQPLANQWQQLPIEPRRRTLLGVSFRPRQCEALDLDPRESLRSLLDYPFQLIRLGAYWNKIEPAPGRFVPDELDWQIEAAESAGKQILVCVGAVKTFGYPEFFVPAHHLPRPIPEGSLVTPANHRQLLEAATEHIARVVERFGDRPSIVGWQVEHEAVDPLGLEHSWRLSTEFVQSEIAAVKRADPHRPVLINAFVNTSIVAALQQWWRTRSQGDSFAFAERHADIVGLDFYPRIGLVSLGPLTAYLDGADRPWQRWWRQRLFTSADRRLMISEGQAEPWETIVVPPDPRSATMFSCTPERLIENYNECMRWPADLYAYLFWGAEYWLSRRRSGDSSYLNAFARVLINGPSTSGRGLGEG